MLKKFSILLIFLAGCAGAIPNLDGVRNGMDKSEVLDVAGSPKRTVRKKTQDYWIYNYYRNDQEWLRQVVFENNKVIKVGRPATRQNWNKDAENPYDAE